MIKIQCEKKLSTAEGPLNLEIDLAIQPREFVTLFGESGTGKTTILRMIAGLTVPEKGFIQVAGETWFDSERNINLPIQKRKIGFVSQQYHLFPHMTLRQNMDFAAGRETKMIPKLLDMMHLNELQAQKPAQLSGGQQQRAALAMAILRQPKIFLLDEPFSALGAEMRSKLQDEVWEIYRRLGIATVFVSHDLGEVFKLSQRVHVLESGKIVKSGQPSAVFSKSNISGKFKFVGQVIEIKPDGVVYILTIQIGNNLTKVVATEDEVEDLGVGDKVIVAAKAFNPIVLKCET